MCPDPNHKDSDPSFHICVDDVYRKGVGNMIGWYHCWSHVPEDETAEGADRRPFKGKNFLTLVAKLRREAFTDDPVTRDEIDDAARYLRKTYLRPEGDDELIRRTLERRQMADEVDVRDAQLIWPPSMPIEEAPLEFRKYLTGRGFPVGRAIDLGVRAVRRWGKAKWLKWTCPAVMFPILHQGKPVNYYCRSINRRVDPKDKGRYASRVPLQSNGVFWAPERPDYKAPVGITEGLIDAEAVRRKIVGSETGVSPENVLATLGGTLHRAQAARLRACPLVYVLGDGDQGGAKLLRSVRDQLPTVKVVDARMPSGMDPDEAPPEAVVERLRPPVSARGIRIRYQRTR